MSNEMARVVAMREFHWKDGWYFSRLPGGDVRVRTPGVGGRDSVRIIPAAEWCSIIAAVSPNDDYGAAQLLHNDGP